MALNIRKHGAEGGDRIRTPLAGPRILRAADRFPASQGSDCNSLLSGSSLSL